MHHSNKEFIFVTPSSFPYKIRWDSVTSLSINMNQLNTSLVNHEPILANQNLIDRNLPESGSTRVVN